MIAFSRFFIRSSISGLSRQVWEARISSRTRDTATKARVDELVHFDQSLNYGTRVEPWVALPRRHRPDHTLSLPAASLGFKDCTKKVWRSPGVHQSSAGYFSRGVGTSCTMAKDALKPPRMNALMELLPTSLFVLFWGIIGAGTIILRIIVSGPTKFFTAKQRKRPACMNDPALGEHKFAQLESGIKLHYVVNGPPDKPLMLFLHGFPECWFSWRYQIKEFSKDYRTVAIDMRGYGESDHPLKVSDYAIQYLVNDVKELVEHLGYKKMVLVAHDWGGNVAHWFTFLHPEMVDKFVVCNMPHPNGFMKHFRSSWSQIGKSWYIMFFQIPYLPEMYIRSNDYEMIDDVLGSVAPGGSKPALAEGEERDAFKYCLGLGSSLRCMVNYYRASIRYERPVVNTVKTSIPTLMVWGVHDLALEKQMAEYSRDYIHNLDLHYVPTAGHWVQQEAPQEVNGAMRQFLKGKKKN